MDEYELIKETSYLLLDYKKDEEQHLYPGLPNLTKFTFLSDNKIMTTSLGSGEDYENFYFEEISEEV